MSVSLSPDAILFWYYLITGTFALSMAGIMATAWVIRRDDTAGLLSLLFVWIALDALLRAILRSPQAIVPMDRVLAYTRITTFGMVASGAFVVDNYLGDHNGHLSVLRRIVRWWDREYIDGDETA